MATLIIKTNASQGTDVLIDDLGYLIPSTGGSVTLTEADEILEAQHSDDLRALLIDDAFGAGSSTLILNDGASDIAQADGAAFLDGVQLPTSGAFGFVKRDSVGDVADSISFNGATLTGAQLGGDLDANSNKITNLADPTAATDAANKRYVDGAVSGIDWKESVRLATDAALPANTAGGSGVGKTLTGDANGALTVDGVAVATNDRVLVKDEVAGADNGIYDVTQTGDAGNPFILTRATDADEDAEVSANLTTWAAEGTANADTIWSLSTNDPITVDTTALTFAQISAGTARGAGLGLVLNGNDIDARSTLGTLTITADDIETTFGAVTGIGSANANGTAASSARSDHVHAHGDRGGDGAVSQHDADQVDVEGAYTNINSPGNVETAISEINDALGGGAKVGKWLQFGNNVRVPGSGTLYMESAGNVLGSQNGVRMLRAGTIVGASLQVDLVDATRTYKLSVRINDAEQDGSITINNALGASSTALNVAYVAGDTVEVALIRTAGSNQSTFDAAAVLIEVVE